MAASVEVRRVSLCWGAPQKVGAQQGYVLSISLQAV